MRTILGLTILRVVRAPVGAYAVVSQQEDEGRQAETSMTVFHQTVWSCCAVRSSVGMLSFYDSKLNITLVTTDGHCLGGA